MKKFSFVLASIVCLGSVTAIAQEKNSVVKPQPTPAATPAPDWQSSYHQESAKDYIRQRAQAKTAARQARIEGMRWLGHSPARPVVSTTPFMSSAPAWVGVTPTVHWSPGVWPFRPHVHTPGWLP